MVSRRLNRAILYIIDILFLNATMMFYEHKNSKYLLKIFPEKHFYPYTYTRRPYNEQMYNNFLDAFKNETFYVDATSTYVLFFNLFLKLFYCIDF